MSKIAFSAPVDGTGVATIQGPETATNLAFPLPARAGEILVAGPAFSVRRITSAQSLTTGAYTVVQFNGVDFDTHSQWNSGTYTFAPTVAGYYQINLSVLCNYTVAADRNTIATIHKNGTEYAWMESSGGTIGRKSASVSAIVFLNGTTDYIQGVGYCDGSSASVAVNRTTMSGFLVRPA